MFWANYFSVTKIINNKSIYSWHFLLSNQEDTMEESGWKNVHGDVFRPPQYPMILSSLLGSGIQLFCMILIVICKLTFHASVRQ